MIFILVCLLIGTCAPQEIRCMDWPHLFQKHSSILENEHGSRIREQYQAYAKNHAPTIVASDVKCIPIQENGEPIIDTKQMRHPRIYMAPDHHEGKHFAGPEFNSGLPNASKMRLTIWHKLEQALTFLDELAPHFGYQPGTIEIRVFEGLRDLATQEQLFVNKVNEIRSAHESMTPEEAELEASKWVSPVKNNVPVHSTGAAVDIRLWNTITQDFVDMGKFGVIWGLNESVPMFSENITPEQKMNRLYLLVAATKAGLISYIYEHWHFSFGDRYAAYWLEKNECNRLACYGPIHD